MTPQKVLILTADFGYGHRSTANAIQEGLRHRYGTGVTTKILSIQDHPKVPFFARGKNSESYDELVKRVPNLYKMGYAFMDMPLPAAALESGLTVIYFEALYDEIKEFEPDVIVVTRESYLAPLWSVFAVTRLHVPVIAVVTDLGTVHRMWFNNVSDLTLVPNERVANLAVECGLVPSSILISGIPIYPHIALETRSPADIRESLGWQRDLLTVLVVSSPRVRNVMTAVRVLNHANFPIQIAVVAGGDEDVYTQLKATEWHVPAHVYDYVTNMPTMLCASDMVVGKAGGLMVTESLAAGLPLLMIDVIEGQETGNAEFVLENVVGARASTPLEIQETLYHWLCDGAKALYAMRDRARELGKADAALMAADAIYDASLKPERADETTEIKRDTLIKMLERFNINWR